ncbi:Apl4 protein [Saccharomycopsis crataegensis]|uniref:AP-1 complex subunit gamma n=1 Tax=Saccharomycopsis crataegensis TaxID=43959 RepID=A0AAV5QMJ7_9ASCO|nr:Apl4 protein [Saccharomycopsis crataegensis]
MGSLKSFIKAVRYSKTIADERSVIRKESAAIRTAFKDVNLSNNKRRVNIQKLLYLYILGEKTHFGQIECIKLLASSNFIDKRLGYLAASLLLDENQEILTLLTNSLVQDLNHPNQFFVALSLSTLATVLSYDLSNDTYNDVLRILTHNGNNPYLKKKAILVSARIIEKNGDLIEIFFENFNKFNLLNVNERDHSVLLAICQMLKSFFIYGDNSIRTALFINALPKLLVILKNLSSTSYNPEYDIMGISDPFLHVSLLQTITLIITLSKVVIEGEETNNQQFVNPNKYNVPKLYGRLNDQYNDLLTQISSNVEFGKNSGNLILYEVVRSIFQLKNSNSALKVLGINLLGKFLTLKDNNIKYISLNTLLTVVKFEPKTVQRHQSIIINCLFDNDISIKRRALELIFEILNENNIRVLIKELVKFLENSAADNSVNGNNNGFNEFNTFSYNLSKDLNDFSLNSGASSKTNSGSAPGTLDNSFSYSLNNLDLKFFITTKLSILLKNYSPNLKFFFKYLIILLNLNGNYLTNDIISFILAIISNIANNKPVSVGAASGSNANDNQLLIKDSLNQIFNLSYNNLSNNGLNLINVWCLGEYGDLILNGKFEHSNSVITGDVIIDYLSRLTKSTTSQLINSYVLTTLLKLSKVLHNDLQTVAKIEMLIRSFTDSININLQMKAIEYLEIMSIKDVNIKNGLLERIPPPMIKEIGKVSLSNSLDNPSASLSASSTNAVTSTDNFLLDLMDDTDASEKPSAPAPAQNNADLLSDIFGSSAPSVAPTKPASADILGLFDSSSSSQSQPVGQAASMVGAAATAAPASEGPSQNVLNLFGNTSSVNNQFLGDAKYEQIFNNEDVSIKLYLKSLATGSAVLEIYILNSSAVDAPLTNFNLLIAVAKSQKLVIVPSEMVTEVNKTNFYKQELKINGKVGSKLKLRVKFSYQLNGATKDVLFDHNVNKTL